MNEQKTILYYAELEGGELPSEVKEGKKYCRFFGTSKAIEYDYFDEVTVFCRNPKVEGIIGSGNFFQKPDGRLCKVCKFRKRR